jgi:5'-3' exonuclease
MPPGHIVLVDGMSLIFRAFFGWKNRDPLLTSTGRDVSMVYSYSHSLMVGLNRKYMFRHYCNDANDQTRCCNENA